ncbi:MAG: hypothetical protein H8E81_08200 [Deltaproteobacteria bacterium]|nr:hypothetical protein [Deltaproteobacteria bacterium]
MKRFAVGALVTLWFILSAWSASADFGEGVRLEADGEIIDVKVGHLVPCVTDWNEDGRKDLIVGQFYYGRIRLYLNQGTDRVPVLTDAGYLQAGGKEIRVPAG